ncbi:MAG: WGR domain-containing protein, partial [Planctomycetota bacterium]
MAKKKATKKKATKKKATKRAKKTVKKSTAKTSAKKKASKATKKSGAKKKPAKKTAKKSPKKKLTKKKSTKKSTKKKATRKKAAKKATTKTARKKAVKKTATRKASAKASAKSDPKKSATVAAKAGASPSVLQSPGYTGKPNKLPRDTYPAGTSPNDFRCWGPPATVDGDFSAVRICDMGSFSQDGKDSNKYYHGALVQDAKDNWYAYFEWGRTGASAPSFQFTQCDSEASARAVFAKQLHSKNDRRGEWVSIAGIRTLRAKKGKDCYLVRPMATRSTGLPDARSIKVNDGAKHKAKPTSGKSKPPSGDKQTRKLLQDLTVATIAYTRGSMADSSLPTQYAIDEARTILSEAQLRLGKIKDSVTAQVKDKELNTLTRLLYGRIPKKTSVHADDSTWVLSKDNILSWQNDLDAFESALYATDIQDQRQPDLLEEMNLSME